MPSDPASAAASAPPRPAPPPPPVVVPPAAVGSQAPLSDASAPPSHVALVLRGAPAGARVLLGDEVLGSAAAPVRVPFGKSPVTLTVTAPGHEPLALEVVPERDRDAEVRLKRRAPRTKSVGAVPSDLESPF